jgi:hypothetical protein
MSEVTSTTTAITAEAQPVTPEEKAAAIHQHLDSIVALLPEPVALEGTPIQFVRRRQGVRDVMIAKAITAQENTPQLKPMFNVEKARTMLAVQGAFRPVYDRMKAMTSGVKFMLDASRAEVGAEVRQLYQVAKTVATRSHDAAQVAEHVKNMSQEIRSGRKARAKTPALKAGDGKEKGQT